MCMCFTLCPPVKGGLIFSVLNIRWLHKNLNLYACCDCFLWSVVFPTRIGPSNFFFFLPLLAQRHPIYQPHWQLLLGSQTALWVSSRLCTSAPSPLYQGSRRSGCSRFLSFSGITKTTEPHVAQEVILIISQSELVSPKMGIMRCGYGYFWISHVVLYLEWSDSSSHAVCFGLPLAWVRGLWESANEDKSVKYSRQSWLRSLFI